MLEAGYAARSAAEHRQILAHLTTRFTLLELTAQVGARALGLQSALFEAGLGRAAGVVDVLHAACAVVHGAVLVHYDADFDHLGTVEPELRQRWVVPRGSLA